MSYLHTYAEGEQARLQRQAELIQPLLYEGWEMLGEPGRILEIGCGVGSQLEFLGQRFPRAALVGVDRSPQQLATARQRVAESVELVEALAEKLPFASASFDMVCTYWVLEHVADPEPILGELNRVLRPGGWAVFSEVHNPSLFFSPHCSRAMSFWQAYNRLQNDLGGNSEIGVQLPYLAVQQGWEVRQLRTFAPCLDGRIRDPERRQQIVQFWIDLLASSLDQLQEHGREFPPFAEVETEMRALAADQRGIIDYQARQLLARKPE